MYKLCPPAVYVHEDVQANLLWRSRVDRVLDALDNRPPVTIYSESDLPQMISEHGLLAGRVAMGGLEKVPDPILLFNRFHFDGQARQRREWFEKACPGAGGYNLSESLTGHGAFVWWPAFLNVEGHRDNVCRPCWRVHFQNGCAHKCSYCGLGGLLVTMVNVEEYIEHFGRLMDAHPWQETYLLEDDADVLCLEPELGCLGPIIEFFGTRPGRYVILHEKSANVDWMLDLKHNGNTIVVWSISGRRQADRFEPVCGSMEQRIDAAARAQAAGYPVRYKFKPIIPVRTWREDAEEAVRLIFQRTRPDLISLCTFMWMSCDEMKRRLDPAELDPQFVLAAEQAADEFAASKSRKGPFPMEKRAEIYRFYLNEIRKYDADIPVSISTESPEMWKLLGEELGSHAANYVCGCGPNSTPGRKLLECSAYTLASGGPVEGFVEL